MEPVKNDGAIVHDDQNSGESEKSMKHQTDDVKQAHSVQKEAEVAEASVETASPEMKDAAAAELPMAQEVIYF